MTRLEEIIEKVRRLTARGYGPRNYLLSVDEQNYDAIISQKGAYIEALTWIADEATTAGPDVKRVAKIALGREWNKDRTKAEEI